MKTAVMTLLIGATGAILLASTSAGAQESAPSACDHLAAHPWDSHRLVAGVYWNRLSARKAVPACRDAVRNDPSPRNMFQLGRSLAKARHYVEAVQWYERAAAARHSQPCPGQRRPREVRDEPQQPAQPRHRGRTSTA